MKPMFLIFGSKHRTAIKYGPPRYDLVVEPCGAGSAGYSTYWEPRKVILVDIDPVIVGTWQYLIKASPREILRIPSNISHVDELSRWPQEVRWLVGWHFNRCVTSPAKSRSVWA